MSEDKTADSLANPILNSPYFPPEQHFELGPKGPTGTVLPGRRASESFIPVPPSRKGKKANDAQAEIDFDVTGERREQNSLINDIRQRVELWRARGYPRVTPMTRKLLEHWAGADGQRDDHMLFCQREAAETAIYLAEVAGRNGEPDFRSRLTGHNETHNGGLNRTALKMATGSGKTVVMAMLIAWQTINKVSTPRDARFSKRFLIVTPGITIRDRLRVLRPEEDVNYYHERDLVPQGLWPLMFEAQIAITNYHSFLLRDSKEIKGVASNTRKLLLAGKNTDPFKETQDDMVSRVLRDFSGRAAGEIVVLNDEAHHCYQTLQAEEAADPDAVEKPDRDDKARNENAGVWFKGLQAIDKKVGIKSVFDMSATPYYLSGSGYPEGFIFPWVVSDFSLMDSIESGIVKVPRMPVDDDAVGDAPTYLNLWEHIGKLLPKRLPKGQLPGDWVPPSVLEGALESLYRSYRARFEAWEANLKALGEPPPVMIVVCPNTTVSKLVFDWIAGVDLAAGHDDQEPNIRPGRLPLLSNVDEGQWLDRPRSVLIDSVALESGDTFKKEFKQAAAVELESFKNEYRRRNPGADVSKLTDEDLMREVMNTVGKPGKLGGQIRCVVSVSMLTEGWDANTVSHILGIRAFRSQLLCEQVVGRGLRRRSYAPNEQGRFEPEYADVYGVPFAFIPSDRATPNPKPARTPETVYSVPGREHLEIAFPKLAGYRVEMPERWTIPDFDEDARLTVSRSELALWVQNAGIAGIEEEVDTEEYRTARAQTVAFKLAAVLARRFAEGTFGEDETAASAQDGAAAPSAAATLGERPWLVPQMVRLAKRWLDECVTVEDGAFIGMLLPAQNLHAAAEKLYGALLRHQGERQRVLLPRYRPSDPTGSTANINFATRKVVVDATRSQLSGVVLDGPKGNSWEESVAGTLERHLDVHSYAKNDRLDFRIPYVHEGRSHDYIPDFLVRMTPQPDGIDRTLIIEVSGGQKSPGPTMAKATTARDQWCPAVNNAREWGIWQYLQVDDIAAASTEINQALDVLASTLQVIKSEPATGALPAGVH